MDIVKIVGINPYDFVDKKDGHRVKGWKYHMMGLPSSAAVNMIGYSVFSMSVKDDIMQSWQSTKQYIPSLGDICSFDCDRFGKLSRFQPIDNPGDLFSEFTP